MNDGFKCIIISLLLNVLPQAGWANICDEAARTASSRTGVPINVLKAITRTETATKKFGEWAPWPWTVNVAGKGAWFLDRDMALSHASKALKQGKTSFDVGCFQLNYRWHSSGFASLSDMFEPNKNAQYAAEFLKNLRGEFGSWTAAAGAYHSRNEEFASKYRRRYSQIYAKLPQSSGPKAVVEPKVKAIPPHKIRKLGSLVALNSLPKVNGLIGQ